MVGQGMNYVDQNTVVLLILPDIQFHSKKKIPETFNIKKKNI